MMKKNKTQKIFNSFIIILLVCFFIPFFIQAGLLDDETTGIDTVGNTTTTTSESSGYSLTGSLSDEATGNDSSSTLQGVSTDGKAVYTLLETSLPGIPDASKGMGGYLEGIFNLAIGIASVLAVLMIVIGGFQYITAEAMPSKTDGKQKITDALIGLVLVLASWLILNTINTDLVNFNTNLETVEYTATPTTPVDTTSTDTSTKICWCAGTATSQICFSSKPTSDYGNVYSSTKVSSSTSCPTPTP